MNGFSYAAPRRHSGQVASSPEEVDAQLLGWIRKAWESAA